MRAWSRLGTVLVVGVLPDQAQRRLMDEASGRQGVVVTLAEQLRSGQPAELAVDERHQLVARVRIAPAPRPQQLGDRGE